MLPELIDVGGAVELTDVLLALGQLLLWIGAVALAALALVLAEVILWPLNKLVSTLTGGIVGQVPGTQTVIRFFTGLLGQAASAVDAAAGSFWHGLKRLVVDVGEEIAGLAILGAYLFYWANTKLASIIWHTFGSWVHGGVKEAEALAKQAERDAIHAERYARSEVRTIDHRIDAIAGTIDHVLQPELKSARDLAKDAEDLASNAWDYITSKKFTSWIEGLIAAAIAAAGILAFDFLKCSSWRSLGNRLTCGMGQLLLDILEGAIAIMVVEDICAITHACIAVLESSEVQDFLTTTTNRLDDLLTCQGVDLPPTLTGPYYAPPPVQPPATLAA